MQRTLELSYDRLVIGSDLSAFAFCYEHNTPAIYSRVLRPYKYNEKENWQRQMQLWDELAFALSEKHLPFSDKIVSLRLEDENILKASTKQSLVCKIKYNHLYISDDYNLEGLPPVIGKTNTDNWVIDWFDVHRGAKHKHDFIEDKENDFVKKIYFYISKRSLKNATRKDLLAVSKISDENLYNDDYGHNVARLKIIKMMKATGIMGSYDKTNDYYLSPKISSSRRDIYPLGKNIYEKFSDNITFLY